MFYRKQITINKTLIKRTRKGQRKRQRQQVAQIRMESRKIRYLKKFWW